MFLALANLFDPTVFARTRQRVETDEALFLAAMGGDLTAFERLYARYERRLFGFLLRLLGDRAEAEEVFHDVFVSALQAKHVRFEEARFSAWLFRIARNAASNRHRSRSRSEGALAKEAAIDGTSATPLDRLLEEERSFRLSTAVKKLPAALADVFHLRCSGLSYEEIAAVLEVPLGTVKSRMNSLTNQLRGEV